MASTYYKLVAINNPEWLQSEFLAGRARFGWSGPQADLRTIGKLNDSQRTPEQRITWRYTQFLLCRIRVSDRVVFQFQQPLRHFLIGEVAEPGYSFDPKTWADFNHILHVRPLTERPVPVG
jgi:hypothetical protein